MEQQYIDYTLGKEYPQSGIHVIFLENKSELEIGRLLSWGEI